MGSFISRHNGHNSQENGSSTKSKNRYQFDQNQSDGIFASHYIMGGMKFETTSPQKFLFGTIHDLNFLGPYNHGTDIHLPRIDHKKRVDKPSVVRPIEILVNMRRSSLRIVRAPSLLPNKEDCEKEEWFHVEFTVDCSIPCTARIHYLVKETHKGNLIPSSNNSSKSDQLELDAGMNQPFCMLTHRICPEKVMSHDQGTNHVDSGLGWSWTNIPVVIQIKSKCGRQCQLTYCTFEKNTQNKYIIKIIKQRVRVGKFNYSLQEVYGIEQKAEGEELETECSICWDEPRDTLILPCRHLAVCSECAEKIRYQQAACPICRKPFKALLKMEISSKNNPNNESVSEIINKIPNKILEVQSSKDKNDNIGDSIPAPVQIVSETKPKKAEEPEKQVDDSGKSQDSGLTSVDPGVRNQSQLSRQPSSSSSAKYEGITKKMFRSNYCWFTGY